jgi:hypothetical protein
MLNVKLDDMSTEIFISSEDVHLAMKYFVKSPYGFVQTKTGVPSKDLPTGYGASWLKKEKGLDRIIEIGKNFQYDEITIGAQFILMGASDGICIPDSVFYHAACAMQKKIDLAYFARGQEIYDAVKHLHPVEENVVFQLPSI